MNGRVLQVKKTTLLALSFTFCVVLFVGLSLYFSLYLKRNNDWFFIFCTLVGLHFLFRASLMRTDSSCYLGFTMFLIGEFYFYSILLNIQYLYPALILLSFASGSFFTYSCFAQPFQLTLSVSLLFVTFALAFYLIHAISIYFFVAILILVVLLLLCRYFLL